MTCKVCRISCALLCAAAVLLSVFSCFALNAQASDCSLTLICKHQENAVPNIEWSIFRVGEKNNMGEYVLTGDFADYPVSLEDIDTASAVQDAADTLESYVILDKLSPIDSAVTDENGTAVVDGVDVGLYLIMGKEFVSGETKITPSPMLVEFTQEQISAGDLTVYPKMTFETVPDTKTKFGVRKTWIIPEDSADKQPQKVVVGIYENGELFKEVTLDSSNNWEYFWEGDPSSEWKVKEVNIDENFTVVYKQNETVFQVENTFVPSENTNSGSSSSGSSSGTSNTGTGNKDKLPQTGSLWWPVPVAAGAGVILIAVGCRMSRKRK